MHQGLPGQEIAQNDSFERIAAETPEARNADSRCEVTIQPMEAPHVAEVHAIERDSFPSPWPQRAFLKVLTSRWTRFFTALKDEMVVGYAGMTLDQPAHILDIAVHRDYRRNGIGSRLLSVVLDTAAKYGAAGVVLEVRASNAAAQLFYRKFGFVPVAVKAGYYAREKEDAILMAKKLADERDGAD